MSAKRTAACLITIAATAGNAAGDALPGSDDRAAELVERITRLEEQVSALAAARDGDRVTAQRAEEIRALVEDVLADLDTGASLLQSGASAATARSGWSSTPRFSSASCTTSATSSTADRQGKEDSRSRRRAGPETIV